MKAQRYRLNYPPHSLDEVREAVHQLHLRSPTTATQILAGVASDILDLASELEASPQVLDSKDIQNLILGTRWFQTTA